MNKRNLAVAAALVVVIICAWLWWVVPKEVDMANYAPANSLLFLETNSPSNITNALASTDAWQIIERTYKPLHLPAKPSFLQRLIRWTGIGPVNSVLIARSQVAVVVTDLGTSEEGETLKIKPEGALVIQTHTAEFRIRSAVMSAVERFAKTAYGQPSEARKVIEGIELVTWGAPSGDRQIVAAVLGSLVVVGNTEKAVRACLDTSQGRLPNLNQDVELHRVRQEIKSADALTFGYVPATNSPRILAIGFPLLYGGTAGGTDLQRILTTNSAKLVGNLAWTSRSYQNGIEDRYLISLQPEVAQRLKSNFTSLESDTQIRQLLPRETYSLTFYNFKRPADVWQDLNLAISSRVDTLSSVLFSSLLKTALTDYGIEEPEPFLEAVKGTIVTARVGREGDRTVLIAEVSDSQKLSSLLSKQMGGATKNKAGVEIFLDLQADKAAALIDTRIVVGTRSEVERIAELSPDGLLSGDQLLRITSLVANPGDSSIVTYTDDSDRVRNFASAIMTLSGKSAEGSANLDERISALPYSATQTTLSGSALLRVNRSPLGQFSNLLPLIIPQ